MDGGPPTPRGEELQLHGRFLRALARGLVGDPTRAEDLLQDTYTRALAHPARHGAAPRAWLAQILRRLAWREGRRESERVTREALAGEERARREVVEAPQLLGEIELARGVLECVERLREPYQSTIYLRYYRGLTPQHIAAEQGVPVKTVKTRLLRALELLRSELDRRTGRREAWVALLLPLARQATPAPFARALPRTLSPSVVLGALGLAAAIGGAWWLARTPAAGGALPAAIADDVTAPASPRTVVSGAREPRDLSGRSAPEPAAPLEGVRLSGRVLTADGLALAGAEIRAHLFDSGWHGQGREAGRDSELDSRDSARARSDASGAFELALERAGLVRLEVELDGFAPEGRRIAVYRGERRTLDPLVLAPGVFLAGRVLDPTGVPVPAAELWQTREDEGLVFGADGAHEERVATSDARGRFRVARQALGDFRLEARAPGFAPASVEGTSTRAGEELDALEVVLTPGLSITGRVFGLAPEELSEAWVLARREATTPEVSPRAPTRLTLDERGAFVLDSLSPDEEVELVLVQGALQGARQGASEGTDETPRLRAEPVLARAGATDVLLEARASAPRRREAEPEPSAAPAGDATLEIHVLRADGTPASGALVSHLATARGRGPSEVRAADEAGQLLWSELAAGEHRFAVVIGGLGGDETRDAWSSVELSAEGHGVLELAATPSADLTGVARAAGAPLADARLWLRGGGRGGYGAALVARTDGEGRFRFAGLALGSYRLELQHASRARPELRELELVAGGTELDFDLAEGTLAGRVLTADGAGVAGATLRVRSEPSPVFGARAGAAAATSDPLGRFELHGIDPEASLRLEIAAEGFATLQTPALNAAEFAELALQPEALLDVHLELERASARPVPVRAEGPHGETLVFTLTGGERTRLRGLGAGTWKLALLRGGRGPRGEPPETRTVELVTDRANELVWALR